MKSKTSDNPFHIPRGSKAFDLVVAEEKRKEDEKARTKNQGATAIPPRFRRTTIRELVGEPAKLKDKPDNPPIFRTREPREGMRDFIQKKREMFIIGMLIKEKDEEIKKMKKDCDKEEEKLKSNFQQLEQQKGDHDRMVQRTHQESQEQSRKLEKEAEDQQKLGQELKRLEQQIAKIQADIDKLKDKKQEHKDYKKFLDKLIEEEILSERLMEEKRKKELRKAKRAEYIARAEDCERKIERLKQGLPELSEEEIKKIQEQNEKDMIERGDITIEEIQERQEKEKEEKERLDKERLDKEKEQMKQSKKVQRKISQMGLQDDQKKDKDRSGGASTQTWSVTGGAPGYKEPKKEDKPIVQADIQEADQVLSEEEKLNKRNNRIAELEEEAMKLRKLAKDAMVVTYREEYDWMYFKDTEKVMGVLAKMKDDNLFLTQIRQQDSEKVQKLMKTKTQMRFAENRQIQQAELERKNQERNAAAIARSTGRTVKKVGRPDMFRSERPKMKREVIKEERKLTEEELELLEFFSE
ncbi:MAG: hypothetical protein EZS28_007811 [Streblomastix strix]|uniref:DUF4200 domain-containing protein n=1 Tax=Streblomastix strix TaxID=222440 RepID=A0A5J4WQ21_9EUKA|nr:MAG: hypothetical protein EZS28_007811 [Streblomastix strix]